MCTKYADKPEKNHVCKKELYVIVKVIIIRLLREKHTNTKNTEIMVFKCTYFFYSFALLLLVLVGIRGVRVYPYPWVRVG